MHTEYAEYIKIRMIKKWKCVFVCNSSVDTIFEDNSDNTGFADYHNNWLIGRCKLN